jgi:acetoin utilization deacetylase AcuC-like enzyme
VSETVPASGAGGRRVWGIYDERFLRHELAGHPERPARLRHVVAELQRRSLWERVTWLPAAAASEDQLATVHDPEYVALIREASAAGGGMLDLNTYLTADSHEVACLAAGSTVGLTGTVVGERGVGFALVRPPGHHAMPQRAMGFCLFNNIALAAEHAGRELGLERVAIVDWDLHHGNGTQEAFFHRPDVLYCSIHESPKFPGTGARDEIGVWAGEGYTVNVPLRSGAADEHYLRAFDEVFAPIVRAFGPQLILVSAGYDAHMADPIGGMALSVAGFRQMAERVLAWADELCEGRLVLVLEGGYDLEGLARGVAVTFEALLGLRSAAEDRPPPLHPRLAEELDKQLEMAKIVQRQFWCLGGA